MSKIEVFENYSNIPEYACGCVVVVGNFDGVHLGHQKVLANAYEVARGLGRKLAILTFEPHPKQLFRPDEPPCRITAQDLKVERLEKSNVSYVYSLPFDWDFASQSAQDFVQNILIDGIGAAHVIVGYDFKFGQLRKGNATTISDAGLPVSVIDEVKCKDAGEYSSSAVRQLLRHGKIAEANKILGWDWEVRAEVFKGDQRGRKLGYPTANMRLDDIVHPSYGAYACLVRVQGENEWRGGATNIGIRPMFEVPLAQIETYIFDFDRDIYGQELCVRPVKRLRGEAKFSSIEELVDQISKDCAQAREVLMGKLPLRG